MIDNLYDEDPNTANRLLNSFFKLVAQSDDAYYQVDGVSNNMVCQGNKPFLHCIVEYKNDKLLKFILDKNHDRSQTFIDIEQENRTRAYGMRSNIDQIIEEDPNFGYLRSPNEVDPRNNKSTLHLAIETQQIEMVRILIENDVDVDLQDNQQKTAMHYIAEGLLANPKSEFYREALILVVISGPDINIYDNNTENPIDIIEKIPDSDIYEIKSIIDIATRDRELAILLDEFVDEINSNENLENRQILLRELENALKRNEESNFELDQLDSLINKITSLIKDGADPYTKNKDNVNCFEVIDMVEDENIKSDLLKLFNNSMFAGKLIATMGYSGGDLMMKGEKSEILKSVESRIKVQSIISAGFDDFCRNFLKIKDSPGESPSALTSPSNGSLDAGSMALSSGQGAEVPIKKQRL